MKKQLRATLLTAVMLLSILLTGLCGLGTMALAADSYGWSKVADSSSLTTSNSAYGVNDKKFTYREWTGDAYTDLQGNEVNAKDVVQVNRVPQHTTASSAPYQDIQSAIVGARDYKKEDSNYVQMLTGAGKNWDVVVLENWADAQQYLQATPSVIAPEYQVAAGEVTQQYGQWSTQQLPASWTYYGYDYTIYTNTQQPWQPNQRTPGVPYAPGYQDATQYNPVGFYRYTFKADDSLLTKSEGGRVIISFQGVESAFYVYLNGKEVGYSEDSYRPAEFDITDYLNETGDNTLVVQVHKFSDGTWLEDQDMLYDGGIFRDVFLYSTNAAHIEDYKVVTDLYNDYEDAKLKLDVDLQNYSASELADMKLNVSLFDKDSKNILGAGYGIDIDVGAIDANSIKSCAGYEIDVQDPALWSAEHPNLYTLVLTLYNSKGESYSIISQQLGFRELEFTSTDWDYEAGKNNTEEYKQVKLNGKPIYIKGVNRHDRVPTTGKYISHDVYETDVKLMKQYNVNTLRTSHYSNDEYMYYLADRYGLYVVTETNAESHALQRSTVRVDGGSVHADTYYFWDLLVDRTVTSYENFKNQTCNIMWSIGNEMSSQRTGNLENSIFAWMINFFKTHDKTRLVHSEGQFDTLGVDVRSNMYPQLTAVANYSGAGKIPYFMCEYDHAMGNAVGNMWEYWEIIRSADNMLGGCIWDWVDQSMRIKIPEGGWNYYGEEFAHDLLFDETGEMDGYYYGMGGDWGDKNNSGNFAQNGLISPDRTPQPELNEVKYVYQSVWVTAEDISTGNVDIYNEYSFTNLNEFDITWELTEDGKVIDSGKLDLDIAPRETKTVAVPFKLPAKEDRPAGAEYYLNFSAKVKAEGATDFVPAGHEVAHEQIAVPADVEVAQIPAYKGDVTIDADSDENYILVSGEKFSFKLNKVTGAMEDYVYGGKTVLAKGPTPNFWRAPVNNDGSRRIEGNAGWQNVSNTDAALESFEVSENSDGLPWIKTVLDLANEDGSVMIMTYTVNSSGEVIVDYYFDCTHSSLKEASAGGPIAVGTEMTAPAGFEKVTWYGNGYTENNDLKEGYGKAYETFRDRIHGAYQSVWNSTVDDLFYPFVQAQDTGRLVGTKWITVANDEGLGVLIAGNGFEASALHFTDDELTKAYHPYELTRHAETTIGIDMISKGNGNSSCGPATLNQYRVHNGLFEYQFTLIPYDAETVKSSDDLMAMSRAYRYNETTQRILGEEVEIQSNGKADMKVTLEGADLSSVRLVIESEIPVGSITSDYDFAYNPANGKIVVYSDDMLKDGSVLFTIHYDLKDQYFVNGEYPVHFDIIQATNGLNNFTYLDTVDGKLIVNNPVIPGDLNRDGRLGNADLILIARYLVDLEKFDAEQKIAADFNEDGAINNKDLVLIARAIVAA